MEVIVIGCGVSGLSCGIRLLERGFAVTIVAERLPPHTTSDVAPAFWYPFKAFPLKRIQRWGQVSLAEFYQLMAVPEAGISAAIMVEFYPTPPSRSWWAGLARYYEPIPAPELPPGYQAGYRAETPLIETPRYMPYLLARFGQLGGQVEQKRITRLSELVGPGRLIVNCSGLGAREIAGDEAVYPIRGQIVRVRQPGLDRQIVNALSEPALTYIVPRSQDCILGGTAEEHNWSVIPDPATAAAIVQRAQVLMPILAGAEVLEHLVGLRPGRKEVRLELERLGPDCAVIHNYGHGGAGFTLSWGCAQEVAELAAKVV
jgi:D-amino-acid oxidase